MILIAQITSSEEDIKYDATENRELATSYSVSPIAKLMWPTWGPSVADRTQVGLMLAP